jgi:hypothetical protein
MPLNRELETESWSGQREVAGVLQVRPCSQVLPTVTCDVEPAVEEVEMNSEWYGNRLRINYVQQVASR